jgi:FkbM family methyltransferase
MPTQGEASEERSGSRWFGRWLPPSVRRRMAASLSSRPMGWLVGRLYRDVVPCYGLRFHVPTPPVSPRTKAQMWLGIYEGGEIRFVRRWLRQDLDLVELGSSLGVVASHCAQRMLPDRRMVCVEANPALIPVLRANLARHAEGRRIDVVQRAIDYDGSEVTLIVGENTSGSFVGAGRDGGVRVPTTTLRELLHEHEIGRYALVCDIEGAEAGLLEEDRAALERCQQAIVELHDTQWRGKTLRVEALADRFHEAGFVERARHGPVYVFERPAIA